ncbi:pyridoxal phosphate-dependent aminotransferase [Cupriavidus necator]|uniref:pyridoxal phosphate-dependent aminotransferase n=1 Tax=Cupriavidus necator TaxID=106590 RepID=UPI0039C276A3
MEFIASRMARIVPSPSIAAMARAKELIAAGEDVCNMAAGEPDFDTPRYIIEAAYQALLAGETKYTAVDGTAQLKRAICAKFERDNGLAVRPDQVSVGAGAKQVLYNILTCSVEDGDEVIVPAPYWVSYPDIVRLNGGVPVFIDTDASSGFKVTPEQLRKSVTSRTKWFILNSPNNPSGTVYTQEELVALGEVLRHYPHVRVLTDDIYEHLIYDGAKYFTFAQVNPDLADRTVTVNGVSKAFAMTGWRIGYAAGPRDLIKAMEKLQSQTSGNPAAVSQAAAVAALNGSTDFLAGWRAEFEARRNRIVELLDGRFGLVCPKPGGAFYVYVSIPTLIGKQTPAGDVIRNDSDFVMYLLSQYKVATVQGSAYGVSPAFRISFATSTATIERACKRVLGACASLR